MTRGGKELCAWSYSCIRKPWGYCYSSQGNKRSSQLSNTHLRQECGHENRFAPICLILLFRADDAPWLCWSRLVCDYEAHLTMELIRLKIIIKYWWMHDIFVALPAYRHTSCSFPDECFPSWPHVVFFSAPEALISKDKAQAVEKEQDEPLSPALTLPVKGGTINPPGLLRGSQLLGGPCPGCSERLPCGSLEWPKDRQPWLCHVSSSIPCLLQEACVARSWEENYLE